MLEPHLLNRGPSLSQNCDGRVTGPVGMAEGGPPESSIKRVIQKSLQIGTITLFFPLSFLSLFLFFDSSNSRHLFSHSYIG